MVCLDEEGAGLVFESVTLMMTSLLLRLLTRPLSLVGDRTPGRRRGELAADELDAGELAVLICPSLLSPDALLTLLLLLRLLLFLVWIDYEISLCRASPRKRNRYFL